MLNVCSLLVYRLARLWFMALLLCCLLPQIPIAIHGQELSMSGPDATKIGASMNIAMAAIVNCNTAVTALCMPQDIFGQQAISNRHWAHACTWAITCPSPSPLSALGCLTTAAPAQGHHHLPIVPIGGSPGPAQPSPPPPQTQT